jgi:hypothetical protein
MKEKLIGTVKKDTNGVISFTIPKTWCEYMDLTGGEKVKVWIEKISGD